MSTVTDTKPKQRAPLTATEIASIKRQYLEGASYKEIMGVHSCGRSQLTNLIRSRGWAAIRKSMHSTEVQATNAELARISKKAGKNVQEYVDKYVKTGDELYDIASKLAKSKGKGKGADARAFAAAVNSLDKLMRGNRLNLGLEDGVRPNQYNIAVQQTVNFNGNEPVNVPVDVTNSEYGDSDSDAIDV